VIELAVVPTFGTQWLLPRLKDFQQKHPEVTVNLTNRTRPSCLPTPTSMPRSTLVMPTGRVPNPTG
jgi:hypothetical protein